MYSQMTAATAVQHGADMNRRAEAARRAKLARAARPTARQAEPALRTPALVGRLVGGYRRTAAPVMARPRTV